MVAYPTSCLPKGVLPRPQLSITPNAVATALDALNAYRDACKQIRSNELARIGQGISVTKLPSGVPRSYKRSKIDDLIR